MFKKLRNKIVLITMTITTVVLIVAGASIMFFTSTIRPEPKPFPNIAPISATDNMPSPPGDDTNREFREYIKNDRQDGNTRLLITLLSVGIAIEIAVFIISYFLSNKIIAPVQDSYDKQKLFIANASHELKTPLAVIQANMEALEVEKGSEEWKDNIEAEITHANKLVLDLLQLAKMDAGNASKNLAEQIDLNTLISERIKIFKPKFTGKISFKKSEITNYFVPRQDISQLLDILLDNATKYGDKKITIALEQKKLIITNDGATIEKADLKKIFDRFYQTDKTKEGSGLGLAIAKAICEQNNWHISCESDAKNTRFIVNLS